MCTGPTCSCCGRRARRHIPASGYGALVAGSERRLTVDDNTAAAFADAGCDELVLFPCSPDREQLRRLADVTLG